MNRPDVQEARRLWEGAIAEVCHSRLLFIDESCAKTNMTRYYARAPRGERVNDHVPCARWETTTMIAAVGRNGPQAPWVLEGALDGAAFEVWVREVLAPTLVSGDIVVMDNLSVHKNTQARELILATGAIVWDLPAYSPDLNPIEKMWSKVKTALRRSKPRDTKALLLAIGDALAQVSLQDIQNWFDSCGYSLI